MITNINIHILQLLQYRVMPERDCSDYLNKRAQILNEFDNFCEQFERRASESFVNPDKHHDDKFKLFDDGSEIGVTPPTID